MHDIHRSHISTTSALVLLSALAAQGVSGDELLDDFEDGGFFDGSPVLWIDFGTPATFDASSGDLVVHNVESAPAIATVDRATFAGSLVSVRAQVSFIDFEEAAFAEFFLLAHGADGSGAYTGGILDSGEVQMRRYGGGDYTYLLSGARVENFDVTKDHVLQFDVIPCGDEVSCSEGKPANLLRLTVEEVGVDPTPPQTFEVTDPDPHEGGVAGFFFERLPAGEPDASAVVRWWQVTDSPPFASEPPTEAPPADLRCTENSSGGLDLSWHVVSRLPDPQTITVNGEEVGEVPPEATTFVVPAKDLHETSRICVSNRDGSECCGFFRGEDLFINCGGPRLDDASGTGLGDGRVWEEDTPTHPSPFLASVETRARDYSTGLAPAFVVADTRLVEPDFVDHSERSRLFATARGSNGDVVYDVHLRRGDYEVTLLFAEGCCSEGCQDIGDPALSKGTCRVFDIVLNGALVDDQFSPHVVAQRGLGNPLPNSDWGVALARGPYTVNDASRVEITLTDPGAETPAGGVFLQGIAIEPTSSTRFLRADCNDDGSVDISDAIFGLGSLFLGQGDAHCDDACDANDDGAVDISDAIMALGVLFLGQGPIPLPGATDCGFDPTDDRLGCEHSAACP